MRERLKIDREPKKLRIESEPYVVFLGRSFVPAIDVYDIKDKREYYIVISARSISMPLKEWQGENDGKLSHLEFWVNKESADKFAKYELEML